jgi:hypothetical protein
MTRLRQCSITHAVGDASPGNWISSPIRCRSHSSKVDQPHQPGIPVAQRDEKVGGIHDPAKRAVHRPDEFGDIAAGSGQTPDVEQDRLHRFEAIEAAFDHLVPLINAQGKY